MEAWQHDLKWVIRSRGVARALDEVLDVFELVITSALTPEERELRRRLAQRLHHAKSQWTLTNEWRKKHNG